MKSDQFVRQSMNTSLTVEQYDALIHTRLQNLNTVKLLHGVMGIVTESGELMDALKKHLIYGKPLDLVNIQEECGDLFWYIALIAHTVGFSFESTFDQNVEKLRARYPNKFTEHDALYRDLDKERAILEEPRTGAGSLD